MNDQQDTTIQVKLFSGKIIPSVKKVFSLISKVFTAGGLAIIFILVNIGYFSYKIYDTVNTSYNEWSQLQLLVSSAENILENNLIEIHSDIAKINDKVNHLSNSVLGPKSFVSHVETEADMYKCGMISASVLREKNVRDIVYDSPKIQGFISSELGLSYEVHILCLDNNAVLVVSGVDSEFATSNLTVLKDALSDAFGVNDVSLGNTEGEGKKDKNDQQQTGKPENP